MPAIQVTNLQKTFRTKRKAAGLGASVRSLFKPEYSTVHARATAAAYKTVRNLLDEMKRLSDEMTAYAASLPPEFVARKASHFQVANMLLEGSLPHILSHIDQIQSAIASAHKQ